MTNKELRKTVERLVVAYNMHLVEVVKDMDALILLRNLHPTFRADFAQRFKEAGLIEPEEAREFVLPSKFGVMPRI